MDLGPARGMGAKVNPVPKFRDQESPRASPSFRSGVKKVNMDDFRSITYLKKSESRRRMALMYLLMELNLGLSKTI